MPVKIQSARVLTIVSHPALLAAVAFGIFMWIVPVRFEKFNLELITVNKHAESFRRSDYLDINGDGRREEIMTRNLATNAAIVSRSLDQNYLGAWKLPGYWFSEADYSVADTDHDGFSEMFAISINSGDSVLVSQIDLLSDTIPISTRYVCRLARLNDTLDQMIEARGMLDITGDSCPEFIFMLTGGFTLMPRNLFAWDLVRDSILVSPLSGQNLRDMVLVPPMGYGPDDRPEIYVEVIATCNHTDAIPYSDTASYATVFTRDLKYLFPPLYTGSAQSSTSTFPFHGADREGILAVTHHRRRNSGHTTLRLVDPAGQEVLVRDSIDLGLVTLPFHWNNEVFLLNQDKGMTSLYTVGPELEVHRVFSASGYFTPMENLDLDEDGQEELVLLGKDDLLAILEEDLESLTKLRIPGAAYGPFSVSPQIIEAGTAKIFIQYSGLAALVEYSRNGLYAFRWICYVGIFMVMVLFFAGLRRLFVISSLRKREREEEVVRLQLKSVMNQLNPHFTFNAINSIGNAILEGNNMEAYEYFTSLSDLIRKTMHNAFEPFKTLGEEIEFVKQYLRIESYRFNDKLQWELKVHPEVDTGIIVPKMLIHIFVENALKHGIFHKPEGGSVEILVHPTSLGILIMVTDNGIGMVRAAEICRERGEGLKILDNYLRLFNKQHNHSISYQLLDRGSPRSVVHGTRVLISVVFRQDRPVPISKEKQRVTSDPGMAL